MRPDNMPRPHAPEFGEDATTAKPTPGPWEAVSYISIGSGRRIWNVQTKAREDFGTFLTQADAILFAEALNVRQECGLTPRQLADQRAELLTALHELLPALMSKSAMMDRHDWMAVETANAAIARAEAVPK